MTLKMYERAIEDFKAKAEEVKERLKSELFERGTEELSVGSHVIRNTSVSSSRFDTKRFKEDFGADAYKEYCKEIVSKRFSVS
jgi:predicted phage-related endonuclease